MSKSKGNSSNIWLDRQQKDEYVLLARKEGYRGRAVYKLKELDDRYHLLKPGMYVIDLGAAPGSWSEYVARRIQPNGVMVATDILPMDSIADVRFVQGDFRESEVLEQLTEIIGETKADLVISDMAPNMSGVAAVDVPQAMYLAELALDLAKQTLRKDGDYVVKLFQGEGFDDLMREMRQVFKSVTIRKPKASRPRSREVYALARGYVV